MDDDDAKLAGVAAGALALVGGFFALRPKRNVMTANPQQFASALALARKWGSLFKVPVPDVMAIAGVESNYNSLAENHNDRAEAVGGAWGMMQIIPDTARHLAGLLKMPIWVVNGAKINNPYYHNSEVITALHDFDGSGRALLDASLNVMLGTFYLRRLSDRFNNFWFVAAAYQQGPRRIQEAIDGAKEIGELGKEYAEAATVRRRELAAKGVA